MWFQNLMNFVKNIKTSYLLLLIIAVGFILRIINLTIGFPILYSSNDEAVYHLSALNMIADKTPFTLGNYGPLGAYLQIPLLLLAFAVLFLDGQIHSFGELELLLVTHEGYFLFVPRMISAMFGTLAIIVSYLLAKELFAKKEIALLSSLMFAVSFNMVHISHLARPWSGAIFFAMLATLFAIKATRQIKKYKNLMIYASLLAAISFGFHQFGGLIIILIGLISLGTRLRKREYLSQILPGLGIFVVLILLLNSLSLGGRIFTLLNPFEKSDPVELVSISLNTGTIFSNFINYLKNLFLSDPMIILLALPLFFIKRNDRVFGGIKLFILINLILAVLIFPPHLVRYFLIAFSFIPIFAGFFLYQILNAKIKKVFLILVIFAAIFNSVIFNLLLLREGTFNQVRRWLDRNIKPETGIIATSHRNLGYVPSASATYEIRKINNGYYARAANLVGDNYYDNVRNIIHSNQLAKSGESMASSATTALKLYPKTEYVVDSYLRGSDRLINHPEELDLELVAHFSPTGNIIYQDYIPELLFDPAHAFPLFKVERVGPYFDVLKVRNRY